MLVATEPLAIPERFRRHAFAPFYLQLLDF
jgi:hypothetical protein